MLLVAGGVAGAAGVLAARKRGAKGAPKEAMAHRMRKRLESMPDDFPPRIMFDNLAAIRENTEKILRILEDQATPVDATSDEPAIEPTQSG